MLSSPTNSILVGEALWLPEPSGQRLLGGYNPFSGVQANSRGR